MDEAADEYHPLFETKAAKGRTAFWLYTLSVLTGISSIIIFRVSHIPEKSSEKWVWIGMLISELWFSFYWLITQFCRSSPIYRFPFKDRLSLRYEKELPGLDVFVCTADPTIEPPLMVVNTVLSVMAYNYPTHKLGVYLSDDGGSELTFYAMLEASRFAKLWIPFCKKYKVEPRTPAAYFSGSFNRRQDQLDDILAEQWSALKILYEEMRDRIETTCMQGRVSAETRRQHKGFREWDIISTPLNHPAIIQILIDGRYQHYTTEDVINQLPTLVYVSREKKPQFHHNFKAGAMNALLRVSSKISNGSIILAVDCDMCSNDPESARDAMCFFMDEKKGHGIAYLQHPQLFNNITKNDLYGISFRAINEIELPSMDAQGGPCFTGSGCFHRRESLCGMKYTKEVAGQKETHINMEVKPSANVIEETSKVLASCTYEGNTQWGKEMGLKYGCAVEDIVTGLSIQARGWRSIYFNPKKPSFTGLCPTSLLQNLVQMKRWSEGQFQIFTSKSCPLINGRGKIPLKHQIAYLPYMLWAPNCFPTLYYVIVPSLSLLRGTSLYPNPSSIWFVPFAFVLVATNGYSLAEFLYCGGTVKGWWNEQRMWLYKRTTSYLFSFTETILGKLGFGEFGFIVTPKVLDDEEALERYQKEVMEFGTCSPMFDILAILAVLNLFVFCWIIKKMVVDVVEIKVFESLVLQIVLCGIIILVNGPVYGGLFFRKDKGSLPASVTCKSTVFAAVICFSIYYGTV